MIIVTGNIGICGYLRGFLWNWASNDSGVVDEAIFSVFGGLFFKIFRDKVRVIVWR